MDLKQAELELSLIKKIIVDSRKTAHDNGWHYIFWGVLVAAALIINYTMILMHINVYYIGYMWLILITIGVIVGILMEIKERKERKFQTFAGKMLGSLWLSSGIAMFIFGFIGPFTHVYKDVFICPVISIVLGIAYHTSGSLQQINWLRNLSYLWWLGGILLFVFPSVHTLLIFALMMLFIQVLPGLLLNRQWKRQNTQTSNID